MRSFVCMVPALLSMLAVTACGSDGDSTGDAGDADAAEDVAADTPSDVDAGGEDVDDTDVADGEDAVADADDTDTSDTSDTSDEEVDAPDDTFDGGDADTNGRPPLADLIVTEFMAIPCAADGNGDWIEIANVGDVTQDLRGLRIVVGTDEIVLSDRDPVRLRSGEYFTVTGEADPDRNGGVLSDLEWPQLRLGSDLGAIELWDGDVLLDRISWDFRTIPASACRSVSVSGGVLTAEGNDIQTNLCPGSEEYGDGDLGTPGLANPVCASVSAQIDRCRTQSPAEISGVPDAEVAQFGRVRIPGVTDVNDGIDFDARLTAEFGWGPVGTAPGSDAWTWSVGAPNLAWNDSLASDDGWDEYLFALTLDMEPGLYEYGWRFGIAAAEGWVYCDLNRGPGRDGSQNGYASADAGRLTVLSEAERCAGVVCNTPPADDCASPTEARSFAADGVCRVVDGGVACVYPPTLDPCGDRGEVCLDGACVPAAVPPAAGQIVISEIMARAVAGTDPGEFVELTSTTSVPLQLGGCALSLAGGASFTLPSGRLEPGSSVVLGASNQRAINGGINGVVQWSSFALPNTSSTLRLNCSGSLIDQAAYATADVVSGVSRQLDRYSFTAAGNDTATSWCLSTTEYGNVAYLGTPGGANDVCPDTPRPITRCRLQEPTEATLLEDETLAAEARVLSVGLTDRSPDADAVRALRVELGVGPALSSPDGAGWMWSNATADTAWNDTDSEDVGWDSYRGTLALDSQTPGAWNFAFRASGDGGVTWTYCDRDAGPGSDGSEDGYDPADAGALTIAPDASVCEPNPCVIEPEFGCLDASTVFVTGPDGICSPTAGTDYTCAYETVFVECDLDSVCVLGECVPAMDRPTPGDLVITEVMARALSAVPDTGEYFELHNPGAVAFDLEGCQIGDDAGFTHVLGVLTIEPGDYLVLAANLNSTLNGGLTAAYRYSGFGFNDAGDQAILRCDGLVIDRVDIEAPFVERGVSWQLEPGLLTATANDSALSWCLSSSTYGSAGFRGTPGAANTLCPGPRFDVTACELEPPTAIALQSGETVTVGGFVEVVGLTDLSDGVDTSPLFRMEFGVGPDGVNPSFAAWAWRAARPDEAWSAAAADRAGVDRWLADVDDAIGAPGPWDYAMRVSGDGGRTWTYCDANGSADGYSPDFAGEITLVVP